MIKIGAGKGKTKTIGSLGNEKRTAGVSLGVPGAQPKLLMTHDEKNIEYYQSQVEPLLKMYNSDGTYTQEDIDEVKDYIQYRISYWSNETPDELFNRLESQGSKPYHSDTRPPTSLTDDEKNMLFSSARRWDRSIEKLRGGENDWMLPPSIRNDDGDYDEDSIHRYLVEIASYDKNYENYYNLFKDKSIFANKNEDERKQYIWENFFTRPNTPKEREFLDKYGDLSYKQFQDRWNNSTAKYDVRPELRKLMTENPQFKNDYSIMVDTLGMLQSVDKDIPKVSLGTELTKPKKGSGYEDALAYMNMYKPEMTFIAPQLKSFTDPHGDEVSLSNKMYALATNWTVGGRDIIDTISHEYGHHVHAYLKTKFYGDEITQLYHKHAENPLSRYSLANDSETFAEAFSYYCSGRKPHKKAEPFMKDFEELMKKAGLTKFKGILKQSNIRKYRYGK